MENRIEVIVGDIHKHEDQKAMLVMLDLYMQDPMGGERNLESKLATRNIEGLKKQANYVFFLAKVNGVVAGIANCFLAFSTFKGKQLINIHDFAVDPKFRRMGIGEAMMGKIVDYCNENNLCKITLEVRKDNFGAKKLYEKTGFKESEPEYLFWEKLV
ncbi:MAG: GNAT family N-acetyltransferase [Prolixibacteraceae bacterium]|jgi:ribosomal protein S18 acetylase RimI-like enzyme|nr:GNAT family N-acetyltransferase [Prolixibacteraceae bacterium]